MPYRNGIVLLLQRTREAGVLARLPTERDRLADELGVPLTDAERTLLRGMKPEMLSAAIRAEQARAEK